MIVAAASIAPIKGAPMVPQLDADVGSDVEPDSTEETVLLEAANRTRAFVVQIHEDLVRCDPVGRRGAQRVCTTQSVSRPDEYAVE